MIKKKEVRVCDFCDKEITDEFIHNQDVPHEGCSEILIFRKDGSSDSYDVGGQDYCNIDCLFSDIKNALKNKGVKE